MYVISSCVKSLWLESYTELIRCGNMKIIIMDSLPRNITSVARTASLLHNLAGFFWRCDVTGTQIISVPSQSIIPAMLIS